MNSSDPAGSSLRDAIRTHYTADEASVVRELIAQIRLDASERNAVAAAGAKIVDQVRNETTPSMMESFLAEYGLSTAEGVGLMCLAEALLRVPDAETIDELIYDKIEPSNWGAHLGHSSSPLINASTWALLLTGKVLEDDPNMPAAALRSLVRRVGEPLVRTAVAQAMKLLGRQFVLGQTIEEGMRNAGELEGEGYTYSYDMLGEAARTEADAIRYHQAYAKAIDAIAKAGKGRCAFEPWNFSQTVGAASTLRVHPPCHGHGRTGAARTQPRATGRRRQHRLQHRRRGTGPARPVAGRNRTAAVRCFARGLEWSRHRGAGLRQARRSPVIESSMTWPSATTAKSWCGWSRAPTGIPR